MAPPTTPTTTNTTPTPTPVTPPAEPVKAPEVKVEKKAAPPPKTTVTYEPADDRFILRPFFGLGFGRVGNGDGTIFSVGPTSKNTGGDWYMFNLGADAEFRVARAFNKKVSFLVGGTLNATFHRGGQNTGGSYLNGAELGLSLTMDAMNAWGTRTKVFGPSRLTLQGGLIAATGNTTAGDNFSLDKTGGAGGFLRGAIDLIGFHINNSGDTLNLGLWGETGVLPDARGGANYPYLAGGVGISVPIRWPGASKTKLVEVCSVSQSTLEDLSRELPQLRQAVAEQYADYQTLSGVLQKKGYDSDTVRKYLRAGKIEQLKAQETARVEAEGQKANKKPDEIKKDVAAALKAKEKDFFAQAEVEYPDGFDYYNVKLPNQAQIPDKIPADCNEVEALRKQLEDEKTALGKTSQIIYDKM